LELGSESVKEHKIILDFCVQNEIPFITIGPLFLEQNPTGFLNHEAFRNQAEKMNISEKIILLKGSRGIALEKLIDLF
jgi:UDP-N-acetylmuramoyl-tripeptide--D-alanyl-D-alanine ligase